MAAFLDSTTVTQLIIVTALCTALHPALAKSAGFRCLPLPSNQNDMCWINNWHPGLDCSTVAGQTKTEIDTWDTMREVLSYLKEAVPLPGTATPTPATPRSARRSSTACTPISPGSPPQATALTRTASTDIMEQEMKTNPATGRDSASLPAAHPDLPADFYIRLLNLPACKRGEPCDGCGRCEH